MCALFLWYARDICDVLVHQIDGPIQQCGEHRHERREENNKEKTGSEEERPVAGRLNGTTSSDVFRCPIVAFQVKPNQEQHQQRSRRLRTLRTRRRASRRRRKRHGRRL